MPPFARPVHAAPRSPPALRAVLPTRAARCPVRAARLAAAPLHVRTTARHPTRAVPPALAAHSSHAPPFPRLPPYPLRARRPVSAAWAGRRDSSTTLQPHRAALTCKPAACLLCRFPGHRLPCHALRTRLARNHDCITYLTCNYDTYNVTTAPRRAHRS
jgi:hypothetical protein